MKEKTKIEELSENILAAAKRVLQGKVPESVVSVEKAKDKTGWKALVEVLERKAVPDSQDLIGVYEMEVGADGEILGYKKVKAKRRTDRTDTES